MERLSGRSWLRVGVIAALVAVIALGFVAWRVLFDGSDAAEDEPDLVVAAQATLTAREALHEPTPTLPAPTRAPATSTPTVFELQSACAADALLAGLPPGLPLGFPDHTRWYGSEQAGLWASPSDFTAFVPAGIGDSSYIWFAGEATPILWFGTARPVEMTGERLDASGSLEFVRAYDRPTEGQGLTSETQWTDVLIPEPGCWRLTGTTEESSLTFTVEVAPVAQRADFQLLRTLFDARPYDPPATCAETPLVGPDAREEGEFAHYWLEANGISVDVGTWFVALRQQNLGVYGVEVAAGVRATFTRLDGDGEAFMPTVLGLNSSARLLQFVFPSPGCWELELATETQTAVFTLYVYPQECAPKPEGDGFLVACEPPQS